MHINNLVSRNSILAGLLKKYERGAPESVPPPIARETHKERECMCVCICVCTYVCVCTKSLCFTAHPTKDRTRMCWGSFVSSIQILCYKKSEISTTRNCVSPIFRTHARRNQLKHTCMPISIRGGYD